MPKTYSIAVGTYDGVLAGWNYVDDSLRLLFATPVHGGSLRSLARTGATLLSCGYDEILQTHDWNKQVTSSGQVRTPADFGTPVCSAFCATTHCLVGFAGGKMVIYKKRDWSVQHVLGGHEGGVASIAAHPSGSLALSAGVSDGKLKLWDLTKGRLAYVNKIHPAHTNIQGRTHYDPVVSLVWSPSGDRYGFAYGSHITVRDVDTGKDLLDVELPCRVNQICFLEDGAYVAAAGNDGSLPVLAVDGETDEERPAILAIEPVEGPVAGEERYKCIQSVEGTILATANSAGVVSLMDLKGAIHMIQSPSEETPVHPSSDEDDEDDGDEDSMDSENDDEKELAVEILDSVVLGSGARITCMVAAAIETEKKEEATPEPTSKPVVEEDESEEPQPADDPSRKRGRDDHKIAMDPEAVAKARALVAEAKVIQENRRKKKKKKH